MADAGGAFVTRAFEKILRDSNHRRHSKLQEAVKAYLDRPKDNVFVEFALSEVSTEKDGTVEITEEVVGLDQVDDSRNIQQQNSANVNAAAATMAEAGHSLEGNEAEIIINPIKLAIETKQSKLIEPALDCLHKLIAYGHLEGDAGVEGGKNSAVLTDLFQLVCNCSDFTAVDSVVLQVIKVILTAVASSTFRVHGDCLVLGIRTCYNIVLNSKNQVNLVTAKGTLTQMIDVVFKRMEAVESGKKESSVVKSYARAEAPFAAMKQGSTPQQAEDLPSEPPAVVAEAAEVGETAANGSTEVEIKAEKAEQPAPITVEEIQNLAGESNISGLEAALEQAVGPASHAESADKGIKLETLLTGQRDALLVFRTLCKMAMKEGTDDIIIRTKSLSLELLLGLLEGMSPQFTINFAFIDSIKMYLCYALVRAYVSTVERVFQLACSIFSVLIGRFRESLKAEIGLFFPLVVLRSLDSLDGPVSHRSSVLKMLENLCREPQTLADVFVNYDCDLEATNLFERMVNSLSKISQGMSGGDPESVQVSALKVVSLQCLVNVLSSLSYWSLKDKPKVEEEKEAAEKFLSEPGADAEVRGVKEDSESQADRFGKAKAHKATMEAAIAQFNLKPSKGIAFLESHNLVQREPQAVANFLRNTPGLSKTLVGDYLGEFDEFHVAVMHAYIDSMAFSSLQFDDAIRESLKGFRLPGEAQKIDRIMEKFAERYCRDNPGIFKTADTAYVLAYAVIMLNTDAHNPVVTAKMTKADFVRINSGAEGEEGAPVPLLEQIYDSIVVNEITLNDEGLRGRAGEQEEDRGSLLAVLNLTTPRRRASDENSNESQAIVKSTQRLVRDGGPKRGEFHTAVQSELARPMLEAVGWSLLAAFAVTMEDSESKPRVALCMEGFRLGICLTRQMGMDTLRYAFLTSLVRFTFLHAPKDMKPKNVEALRTLLGLAADHPDALQDTWNAVLECVSRLEHISSSPAISGTLLAASPLATRDALLASLTEMLGKQCDQVFLTSMSLPSDQVVEFFSALCGVSHEELRSMPPRVFSLQKLVEISYYNLNRIRMVWARIWTLLSVHFVQAGGHADPKIAMYAIDALRQLAMKYLERAELANFTFQNDILKPFVVIMRTSRSGQIRDLIVQCIVQMIVHHASSIKSGWKSVFMVLTTAAADSNGLTVGAAFDNLEQVLLEHFEQVVGDCFMDCVNCLIAFANNKTSPRISLKAIALLRICEDRLAEGRVPGGATRPISSEGLQGDAVVAEFYWFPMLAGLSDLASDPRVEVRNCALEVLFDLLKARGHGFSPKFWESVFERVLFPIFDYVRHAGSDGARPARVDLWLLDTSTTSLHLLCDLFCCFFPAVSFLLPPLLGLLADCSLRQDQRLPAVAMAALLRLLDSGGPFFLPSHWALLLDCLQQVSAASRPTELLPGVAEVEEGGESGGGAQLVPRISIPRGSESNYLFDRNVSVKGGLPEAVKEAAKSQEAGLQPAAPSEEGQESQQGHEETRADQTTQEAEEPPRPSDADIQEILERVRTKNYTQMLVLHTLDHLQSLHWQRLSPSNKRLFLTLTESLLTVTSEYNSYHNLRSRIRAHPEDIPPPNLLRQELATVQLYISALLRSFPAPSSPFLALPSALSSPIPVETGPIVRKYVLAKPTLVAPPVPLPPLAVDPVEQAELQREAREKLFALFRKVLEECAALQAEAKEAMGPEVHRVLTLRAPVVAKVLKTLAVLDEATFNSFLGDLYPFFTTLVCSEQMETRKALGDLFKAKLVPKLT